MNRFIQILRDNLMITGINKIKVPTIAIKEVTRLVFKNKLDITKAATAKAIPTP